MMNTEPNGDRFHTPLMRGAGTGAVLAVPASRVEWDHCQRLAAILHQRFDDPVLTEAGLLHGIGAHAVERLGASGRPEVVAILEDVEKLRALEFRDEDLTGSALRNVLPLLRDPRSGVLLAFDQLDHVDPDQSFRRWSAKFHRLPEIGVDALPRETAHLDPLVELGSYPRFLRRVVAPVAALSGFWRERNALDDCATLIWDPDRAKDISIEVRRASGACRRLVGEIEASFGDGADASVLWEWRHLGRLDRELPRSNDQLASAFDARIGTLGFVTVVCVDEDECYRLLGRIHRHFEGRGEAFRDYIGNKKGDDYRALHTRVGRQGAGRGPREISIRLISRSDDLKRSQPARRWHDLRPTNPAGPMRVFTLHGDPVDLQPGATVAAFAVEVHDALLFYAIGARVNRRTVELNYKLSPGDVVEVLKSERLQPLPSTWKTWIPEILPQSTTSLRESTPNPTHRRVRKAYKRLFESELGRQGYAELERHLIREGIRRVPSMDEIGRFILAAVNSLSGAPRSAWLDADWWLQQIGALVYNSKDFDPLFEVQLTKDFQGLLFEKVRDLVAASQLCEELGIDPRTAGTFSLVRCSACHPTTSDQILVERTYSLLTLHRAGADCAKDARPVDAIGPFEDQFLWIEGPNRVGFAATVAETFSKHGIDIEEIIARAINQQRAAVRVQLAPLPATRLKQVLETLRSNHGLKVTDPDAGQATSEERNHFPPRSMRSATPLTDFVDSPYRVGDALYQDADFYGQQSSLTKLRTIFEGLLANPRGHGRRCSILGPIKVGKTSLALAFLRRMSKDHDRVTTIYERATQTMTWQEMEANLRETILKESAEVAARNNRSFDLPPDIARNTNMYTVVNSVRERTGGPMIIVIDEAPWLFKTSHEGGEASRLAEVVAQLLRAGVMLICVGPKVGFERIPPRLRPILRDGTDVSVDKLTLLEVRDLLLARQKGGRYSILIESGIAEAVMKATRGNPFWTAALADKMWELNHERYDKTVFENAQARLARDKIKFYDRWDDEDQSWHPNSTIKGIVRKLLQELAKETPPTDKMVRMRTQTALRRLADDSIPSADELLKELEDLGTIELNAESAGKDQMWSLAAPILALHLREHLHNA